jgi:hypothetical protein
MKFILITSLLLFSFLNAQAVVIPGWDRPIKTAERVETINSSGELMTVEATDLTFTTNDSDKSQKLFVVLDGVEFIFEIVSKQTGACNSMESSALAVESHGNEYMVATFFDHSSRICNDLRTFDYEMIIELRDTETHQVLGQLDLGIQLNSVFTIQSQPSLEKEGSVRVMPDVKLQDLDLTVIRITR